MLTNEFVSVRWLSKLSRGDMWPDCRKFTASTWLHRILCNEWTVNISPWNHHWAVTLNTSCYNPLEKLVWNSQAARGWEISTQWHPLQGQSIFAAQVKHIWHFKMGVVYGQVISASKEDPSDAAISLLMERGDFRLIRPQVIGQLGASGLIWTYLLGNLDQCSLMSQRSLCDSECHPWLRWSLNLTWTDG